MKRTIKSSVRAEKPKKFVGLIKQELVKPTPQKTTTTFAKRKNQPFGLK